LLQFVQETFAVAGLPVEIELEQSGPGVFDDDRLREDIRETTLQISDRARDTNAS
jgi:hypothetical protein